MKSHADIDAFANRCKAAKRKRQSTRVEKHRAPTFEAYLTDGGPAFSFVPWFSRSQYSEADRSAAAEYHEKHFHNVEKPSNSLIKDAVEVDPRAHHKSWILSFKVGKRRKDKPPKVTELAWTYAHTSAPIDNQTVSKLQLRGISTGESEPFRIASSHFKRRFLDYLDRRFRGNFDHVEGIFNRQQFRKLGL